MRVSLFTDHRRVILFFACLINFRGRSRPRNYLTAKFSRSTIYSVRIDVFVMNAHTTQNAQCMHGILS